MTFKIKLDLPRGVKHTPAQNIAKAFAKTSAPQSAEHQMLGERLATQLATGQISNLVAESAFKAVADWNTAQLEAVSLESMDTPHTAEQGVSLADMIRKEYGLDEDGKPAIEAAHPARNPPSLADLMRAQYKKEGTL